MSSGHSSPRRAVVAALTCLLLVLLPVVYVGILNSALRRPTLQFTEGWREPGFAEGWRFAANVPTIGILEVNGNGTLTIKATYPLGPGSTLAAQKTSLPVIDFGAYRYLVVSVKVPPFFVAARVVLWTSADSSVQVLLKTYPDYEWHREVVDLHYFGLSGMSQLYMLELVAMIVEKPSATEEVAMYQDLFVGRIEGGVG